MTFSDAFFRGLCVDYESGIQRIDINCEKYTTNEVCRIAGVLQDLLLDKWITAVEKGIALYGECEELKKLEEEKAEWDEYCGPAVVSFEPEQKRVFVNFMQPLCITYDNGEKHDIGLGNEAVLAALKDFVSYYPQVSYSGYIGYIYVENEEEKIVQYEVSYNVEPNIFGIHEFIGECLALGTMLMGDGFSQKFTNELFTKEDCVGVYKDMMTYSMYLSSGVIKEFLQGVKEVDQETYDQLIADYEKRCA